MTRALTEASNKVWLAYYDEIAEVIDDEILDQCDELFNIGISTGQSLDLPDEYFITAAKKHKAQVG
jgi:hypothetical protein